MLALLFSLFLFQQPVTQEFAKDYHFSTGLMFEKLYSKEYPITLYKDSRDLIWSGTSSIFCSSTESLQSVRARSSKSRRWKNELGKSFREH